jgi:apolipoprotein N-acyltransferase
MQNETPTFISNSANQYKRDSKMKKKNYLPVLWFIIGFGLFMFTRGTMYVPIALVLAPIFILRFSRTQQKPGKAILFTLLGFVLSITIALWGLFDLGDNVSSLMFNTIRSLLLAIVLALPYIADRLIYPRFKGFLSTLVFPVSATALYFLNSLEGPFDGDAVFAHYFYFTGDLSFRQLVSVTGLWGLVFLVSWIASVINWVWENNAQWETIKPGVVIFSSVIAGVFVFGGLQISPLLNSGEVETVRIAAVTLNAQDGKVMNFVEMLENKTFSPFEETIATIDHLTQQAALGGAKIVTFQEYAMVIEKTNEKKFLAELERMAKDHGVYLSLTYAVLIENEKGENRHILLNDMGEVEANYLKRYLLGFGPIGETAYLKKGPEIIPVVETPYGNIGLAICRDMSFAPYARQGGQKNVDIMLDPSADFPQGKGHSYLMRAIENGFSFIRPTHNGFSFAVDYHGNVLASKDYFATSNEIMYADVPTKGKTTLYPIIGDLFGWLSVLGFGAFVVIAIKRKREEK